MVIDPPGPPAPNCEWQVCVHETARGGTLEIWAWNGEPVVATVTLSFDVIENAWPPDTLPIVRTVAPGENLMLTHLEPVDRARPVGAHPSVAIDLGSDETQPDADVLYSMPFGGTAARQLIGGYGSATHLEANFYALDFAMPEGTPVLAARSGIVVDVQDGFLRGGLNPELLQRANLVAIAHSDGTLASYGHLRAGIRVAEGDTVRRGQLLGFSGSTGFSAQPHLHFHVGKRLMGGENRTIPVTMRDRDGTAVELVEGVWYQPAAQWAPRSRFPKKAPAWRRE
jgi:murein DD-endopeptidase MepM/ murein hydrolase activator NlpD